VSERAARFCVKEIRKRSRSRFLRKLQQADEVPFLAPMIGDGYSNANLPSMIVPEGTAKPLS